MSYYMTVELKDGDDTYRAAIARGPNHLAEAISDEVGLILLEEGYGLEFLAWQTRRQDIVKQVRKLDAGLSTSKIFSFINELGGAFLPGMDGFARFQAPRYKQMIENIEAERDALLRFKSSPVFVRAAEDYDLLMTGVGDGWPWSGVLRRKDDDELPTFGELFEVSR